MLIHVGINLHRRFAVLVNDMSELNIDKEYIANSIQEQDQQLIEMSNGCLCCTLREDLLKDIVKVAHQNKYVTLCIQHVWDNSLMHEL